MYKGEKVRLREYKKEDIKLAQEFVNDVEVKKMINPGIPYLYTYEDEEKWFEKVSALNQTYVFAVEILERNKYIGGCGINELDWKNRVVTIGIL